MATQYANIKGIDLLQAPAGMNKGALALVTFDMGNVAQSGGGTDTILLGGGGFNQGVANTASLATIIGNRLRNGGAVTLTFVGAPAFPGYYAGAPVYPQAGSISGANVIGIATYTTATGSTGKSTSTATWDAAAGIVVGFTDTVG
jgi:hypothetical protein